MTPAEFAAMIKAKYPAYASVPDDQLVSAMLDKYPTYRSQVELVNLKAQGGDTVNGVDPNAPPSLLTRFIKPLEHLANPRSGLDFAALLTPSSVVPMAAGATTMGSRIAEASANTPPAEGILGRITRPVSVLNTAMKTAAGRATGRIPQFGEEAYKARPLIEQMRGFPESGPMPLWKPGSPPVNPELPSFPQKPLYQQMEELPATSAPATVRAPGPAASGREASLPPAPPRLAGKAPTLEDVLTEAIQEAASKPEPGTLSTAAPELETAGEGPLSQSGSFGKSGRLGQPGGYSSGRPGMTGEQYDDLITTPSNVPGRAVGAPEITPAAATPGGRAVAPETPASAAPPSAVESAPAATPTASSDLTSQVLESLGETVPADQLTSSIERAQPVGPQQIEDARRYLGSRDAAANLGLSQDEVMRAAPGPSQRPLLLDDLQGGGDRSTLIEKFLTDLLGK